MMAMWRRRRSKVARILHLLIGAGALRLPPPALTPRL